MDSHLPDPSYLDQSAPLPVQPNIPVNLKPSPPQLVSSLDTLRPPSSLRAQRLFGPLQQWQEELATPTIPPLLSVVVHETAPVALDYIANQFKPHRDTQPKNKMEQESFESLKKQCIESITGGIFSSCTEAEIQAFRNPEEIFAFFISHVSDAEVMIIIQNLFDEIGDYIQSASVRFKTLPEGDEKENLKEKLHNLTHWLNEKIPIFKAKLDASGIGYSFHYEKLVEGLYNAAELSNAAADMFTPVAGYIAPPLAVIGIGLEGWKLYREKQHLSHVKTWENTFSPKSFGEVYTRQAEIYDKRCGKNRPVVQKFVQAQIALLQDHKVDEVRQNLKNMRCDLPEFKGLDSVALAAALEKNEEKILRRIVSTQEEASVSIRKALSALGSKKAEMEKGLLKAKLSKTTVVFGCSVVVAALAIAFKALAIAGIAISGAAIMGTGFGAVAVVAIATVLGLAYFYYKKPNTMKALFSLARLKMIKSKLLLFVENLKKRKMAHKISTVAHRLHVKETRIQHIQKYLKNDDVFLEEYRPEIEKYIGKNEKDPEKIKVALNKYLIKVQNQKAKEENRLKAVKQKYQDASSAVKELEKKIKAAELEIAEAGWKDYQRLAKLTDQFDIAEAIAKWMLKDETLLDDEETGRVLQTLNIDLKKLRESVDPDQAVIEVANVVRGIFGAEDEDFVHMIEHAWEQKMEIDHGLVQST